VSRLIWVQPRPGMHVACGAAWTYLIAEAPHSIVLTRYRSHADEGRPISGEYDVAADAALHAIPLNGAFGVFPDTAGGVVGHMKARAQDYEAGGNAGPNPLWQHDEAHSK